MSTGKQTGVVKFFNQEKGFGFIKPDNNGEDIFVHVSGLTDDLKHEIKENDRVEFDIKDGKKGLNAINVVIE